MARKKGLLQNKPVILAAGGGGLVFAALVAIFVLGFGFDTFPQIDAESIIQKALTVDEIAQNEGVIFDINNALKDALGDGSPDSICNDAGQEISCDEIISPTDPPPINQIIMNGTDNLIDDPPITNGTFSDDPPIDQICDQLDLGCGTRSLTLTSIVTKTDSSGVVTIVEETFSVGQLAFFVEDISGIDFATGRISIEMILTPDDELINFQGVVAGLGEFDVLIGGESVLPSKIPIVITPTIPAGDFSEFKVRFGSVKSDDYLFSFADHFDKFLNEQISRLSFVTTFTFEEGTTTSFGVTDLKVFSMDIARDDQKIIIVNEQGIEERIFPSDSRLVISSVPKLYSGEACLVYACTRACGSCAQTCTGSPGITAPCIGVASTSPAGTAPAPTLTSINIVDVDGKLITTSTGGSGPSLFDYNQLTRNANYTMTVGSPVFSSVLDYGKTQETQSYTCFSDATVIIGLSTYGVYPWISTGAYKTPIGITIGDTQCGFP